MGSVFCIALSLPYSVGLGLAALGLWRTSLDFRGLFALAAMLGLSMSYLLLIISPSVIVSISAGGALSAFGWVLWLPFFSRLGRPSAASLFIGAALALYALTQFGSPISAWDARSIWFFHAKKIFAAGNFWASAHWLNPSYLFSHPHYSPFVPSLAAQAAAAAGFWNEVVPKVSLYLLIAAAFLALRCRVRYAPSSLFLLALVAPLRLGEWMWNGYMDGFLTLYAALAALFLAEWLRESKPNALALGLAALGVAVNVKNEGSLLLLAGVFALCGARAWRGLSALERFGPTYLAIGLPLLAFCLTLVRKISIGIPDPYTAGTSSRFLGRMVSLDSWMQIGHHLFYTGGLWKVLLLHLAMAVVTRARRENLPLESRFCLAFGYVYWALMWLVYLATPYELSWQLEDSADRTMAPVCGLFLLAVYFWMRRLEGDGKTLAAQKAG